MRSDKLARVLWQCFYKLIKILPCTWLCNTGWYDGLSPKLNPTPLSCCRPPKPPRSCILWALHGLTRPRKVFFLFVWDAILHELVPALLPCRHPRGPPELILRIKFYSFLHACPLCPHCYEKIPCVACSAGSTNDERSLLLLLVLTSKASAPVYAWGHASLPLGIQIRGGGRKIGCHFSVAATMWNPVVDLRKQGHRGPYAGEALKNTIKFYEVFSCWSLRWKGPDDEQIFM